MAKKFKKNLFALTGMILISGVMLAPFSTLALGPAIPFVPPADPPLGAVPTRDNTLQSKEVAITILGFRAPAGISLDFITYIALEFIISELTDSIVTWINNGFEGGPAFAVDLEGRLLNTADAIAGKIIQDIGGGALCSPFIGNLQNALKLTQNYRSQRNTDKLVGSCTLSQVSQNIEGFLDGDFIGGGGWDAWYVMTQTTYGNPYSSFLNLKFETDSRIASALELDQEQLSWGRGFLSKQECDVFGPDGNCAKWKDVETPGAVIEDQLNRVFGWEGDRLNVADEFDEIVGALIGQLVDVVFSRSGGVFSTGSGTYSRNSSSSANRPGSFGACYPDKDTVIAGQDSVTWNFTGGTIGPDDTIIWTGDNGLSGSGPSVTTTYANPGENGATITYTKVTKVQGQPDVVRTENIQCSPKVKVLKYPPLAVSCKVEPFTGTVGGTLTWTVTITGGSGTLQNNGFILYDNTTDEGPFEEKLIGRNFSRGTLGEIIVTSLIQYLSPGEKSVTITVLDSDPFTEPVVGFRCPQNVYISPTP